MMQRKPKYVEYETFNGMVLWITPLSRNMHQGILAKARELYPLPDAKEYEEDDPNSAPGMDAKIPGDIHPEYLKLKEEAQEKQRQHISTAIDKLCVRFPIYADGKPTGECYTREQVMELFKDELATMRELADLPEDDWKATFQYIIYGSEVDEARIGYIVRDKLPVTQEETDLQIRLFRPLLSGNAAKLLAGKSKASSVSGKPAPESKS